MTGFACSLLIRVGLGDTKTVSHNVSSKCDKHNEQHTNHNRTGIVGNVVVDNQGTSSNMVKQNRPKADRI